MPIQQVTCCRRKSDLWFDNECHQFKQRTRRLERRYIATLRSGDEAAWRAAVRNMHQAFRVKGEQFWTAKISKETGRPRQLWPSIDHLLENSRSSMISCFIADDLCVSFNAKLQTYESALKTRRHQRLRLHHASNSTISPISSLMTSSSSFAVILQSNRPSILSQRGSSGMCRDHLFVHCLVV